MNSPEVLAVADAMNGLVALSILSGLPAGIFFDILGARKTGVAGTAIMVVGVFGTVISILRVNDNLFLISVLLVDVGSIVSNYSFFGFLYHLPG